MLFLLVPLLPRPWDEVRAQRQQGLPVLPFKVPPQFQQEEKSPQGGLDQGVPQDEVRGHSPGESDKSLLDGREAMDRDVMATATSTATSTATPRGYTHY